MSVQAYTDRMAELDSGGAAAAFVKSLGPLSTGELNDLTTLLRTGLASLDDANSRNAAEYMWRRTQFGGTATPGPPVDPADISFDRPGKKSGKTLPLTREGFGRLDAPMPGGRGGGVGGKGSSTGGMDPGGSISRVFVVNWPKAFGGAGVGGVGSPGTGGGSGGDKPADPPDRSRMMAMMSMFGADPMMMSVMGGSLAGRMAIGMQVMGRQAAGMAGSDNPFDVAGGVLGMAGTAGLMTGHPMGMAVGGIALLGSAAAKAAGGLMNFGQNLLKQNFQFAEFSAAMTNVQVTQEIRDIYHGSRTGAARAETAGRLADANENLRRALEPVRNELANTWNLVTAGAVDVGAQAANATADNRGMRTGLFTAFHMATMGAFLPTHALINWLRGRGERVAAPDGADGGDWGGLMPWFLNPEDRRLAPGERIEPGPWQERWNRPRRFD